MIEEAEEFLRSYRRGRAKSTVRNARSNLRHFSDFIERSGLSINQISSDVLEDYFHEMDRENYSNHTIRNRHLTVRQFLDHLGIKEDSDNPANQFKISKYASRKNKREEEALQKRVWLTRDEINQLVENAPQPAVRNRCLILFMYYTACRRSEAAQAKVRNMNFDERKAKINSQKTGKTITVRWQPHLDPLLKEWVKQHREAYTTAPDSPHLFLTQQAEKIAPNHITRIIREAAERAGIQEVLYEDKSGNKRRKITSHALRHSFAVHWLQPPNKGSLEELKKILAHEDVQTTQVYTEIVEDQVDKAYADHAATIGYDSDPSRNPQVCELCGEPSSKLETHHISYDPEEVMDVCSSCHRKIHTTDEYKSLKPDTSRAEARERDWTPY
ncbi:tyrosine-type recombinase/integrase [Halorubrum sp. FL23]|uniref:tyrosine-type recombinase/integrase n=1 Tax=Halorubrum sp. FL23 TaxID=3458704 RepID=UPI0040347621